MNYYNEFDARMAAWLRELIAARLIPEGHVDERSITEVRPEDLEGYVQCHFFAGIGGWPLALDLAGWPRDREIWTGSCPCQPFSSAGKQKGAQDERHLWPAWFRLIRERCPHPIVGEQVASAIGHGWLDGVQSDLEGEDYAVGHCVLGAHSVGAPHIRQRLYWLADSDSGISGGENGHDAERRGGPNPVGNAVVTRLEGHAGHEPDGPEPGRLGADEAGPAPPAGGVGHAFGSSWARSAAIACRDGKFRRVPAESVFLGMAHGIPGTLGAGGDPCAPEIAEAAKGHPLVAKFPGRVPLLHGLGNAINVETAALFISSYLDLNRP